MKIAKKYSHLNGEEYLLVHQPELYQEIQAIVASVDANRFRTKESLEARKKGQMVYAPAELNKAFAKIFWGRGWQSVTRKFYVSDDPAVVKLLEPLSFQEQRALLDKLQLEKIDSFNQTDFVKDQVAVEVQMGKYFAVTYDLFVKHLAFYTGGIINVGIEIVPTKNMQKFMSSGPPFFEKEVHNVLRHGRTVPPVPLVILGIEP